MTAAAPAMSVNIAHLLAHASDFVPPIPSLVAGGTAIEDFRRRVMSRVRDERSNSVWADQSLDMLHELTTWDDPQKFSRRAAAVISALESSVDALSSPAATRDSHSTARTRRVVQTMRDIYVHARAIPEMRDYSLSQMLRIAGTAITGELQQLWSETGSVTPQERELINELFSAVSALPTEGTVLVLPPDGGTATRPELGAYLAEHMPVGVSLNELAKACTDPVTGAAVMSRDHVPSLLTLIGTESVPATVRDQARTVLARAVQQQGVTEIKEYEWNGLDLAADLLRSMLAQPGSLRDAALTGLSPMTSYGFSVSAQSYDPDIADVLFQHSITQDAFGESAAVFISNQVALTRDVPLATARLNTLAPNLTDGHLPTRSYHSGGVRSLVEFAITDAGQDRNFHNALMQVLPKSFDAAYLAIRLLEKSTVFSPDDLASYAGKGNTNFEKKASEQWKRCADAPAAPTPPKKESAWMKEFDDWNDLMVHAQSLDHPTAATLFAVCERALENPKNARSVRYEAGEAILVMLNERLLPLDAVTDGTWPRLARLNGIQGVLDPDLMEQAVHAGGARGKYASEVLLKSLKNA